MAERNQPGSILRIAAQTAFGLGAIGAIGLTLRAGRHNPSAILLALFVLWVLSPFLAMAIVRNTPTLAAVLSRVALYSMMLLLSLGTLAVYGTVALGRPRPQTAFVFVVVPPISVLLIVLVVAVGAIRSRGSRR